MHYHGSCHCGAVTFSFESPEITTAIRCNCSICRRKNALMTPFALAPEQLRIEVKGDALATYTFGNEIAQHHFCKQCGIYPFHQTLRNPGHYRVNIHCIDGLDSSKLNCELFDGASL